MKQILALLAFLPLTALAQTTWPVSVGGSTIGGTPPFYNPENVTIQVNDIVRWTNTSGTHNVNGTQALFPGNPQSFGSGSAQNGNWSFQFAFTIPGVYNYHCTQDGHAATQSGTITVIDATGVSEVRDAASSINVFPVPATSLITIEAIGTQLRTANIVDLDGATVLNVALKGSGRTDVDISTLTAGRYFVLAMDMNGRVTTKPFSKN